jgi:hypothetical protein
MKAWQRELYDACMHAISKIEELQEEGREDPGILRDMKSDLDYCARWMLYGFDPGPKHADKQRYKKRMRSLHQIQEATGQDDLVAPWGFETDEEKEEFRQFWNDWNEQYGEE